MEKHNVLINPTRVTKDVVIRNSHSMIINFVDVLKTLSSLVPQATVFQRVNFVTVKSNVLMDLMMAKLTVVSEDSTSTMSRLVVVIQRPSSRVLTVSVLRTLNTVMVKLNAQINLTKETNYVASENSASITANNAVAIQRANGPVLTVTVLKKANFVMVKPIAQMALMNRSTNSVALKILLSTTIKNVVVKIVSGSALTEIVFPVLKDAMEKPNVQINPMRATMPAASKNTRSIMTKDVDAKRVSGSAPTETVSILNNTVMENHSVKIYPMSPKRNVASRNSHSMTANNVDVTQIPSGLARMETASNKAISVMEKPNVQMVPMIATNSVASRNTPSTMTNTAVVKLTNGNVRTAIASTKLIDAAVKLNAPMDPTKETNAVSVDLASITANNAVAIQRANGPVLTVTVFQ
jgi:hypothetical protein